jgi:hypothetical protein
MAIANGGPSGDEKENSLPRVLIVTIEILFLSLNILKLLLVLISYIAIKESGLCACKTSKI